MPTIENSQPTTQKVKSVASSKQQREREQREYFKAAMKRRVELTAEEHGVKVDSTAIASVILQRKVQEMTTSEVGILGLILYSFAAETVEASQPTPSELVAGL